MPHLFPLWEGNIFLYFFLKIKEEMYSVSFMNLITFDNDFKKCF